VTAEVDADELRRRIREADEQYYNRGSSDLTDAEYDILFVRLRKLEALDPANVPADSPTQRVGAPLPKGGTFATAPHLSPMGSLESLMASRSLPSPNARTSCSHSRTARPSRGAANPNSTASPPTCSTNTACSCADCRAATVRRART
jgi:NAD-dependent DNA ligase